VLARQTDTFPGLAKPAKWLKERFDFIEQSIAPFLRPKYFSMVVSEAYKAARQSVIEQCSDFVASGTSFTHDLALCAVQMYGQVNTASIDPSKPVPSLAAGLPHFSAGWARCWGRDVVSSPSPLDKYRMLISSFVSLSRFVVCSSLLATLEPLETTSWPLAPP
jgi:glycogen debranching enzyme